MILMDFGSNYVVVNGVLRTKDEVWKMYYEAFNDNLVTILIPDENNGFIPYPHLNLGTRLNRDYYASLGHAKCFEKINELLLRDKRNSYVVKDFDNIQDRTFIAYKFVEKGSVAIMRTSKDNFLLIFPGFSDDIEKNRIMCDDALKLIKLLNVNLSQGCFQINGQVIFSLEAFEEYCHLLKSNDKPRKRQLQVKKKK